MFWFFLWRMTLLGLVLGPLSTIVCILIQAALLPLLSLILGAV